MKKIWYFALCSLLFAFVFSGCPKKPLVKPTETKPEIKPEVKPPGIKPEIKKEVKPPIVVEEEEEEIKIREPEVRTKELEPLPGIKLVYFAFDSYQLEAEAEKVLINNVKFLKANPNLKIAVEGHCCECGSVEYNLGLGDKRAKTVRDYYIQLGIVPERIATISYGEEKPLYKNVGPPDSPQCLFNRRVETKALIEKKATP